MAQQISSTTIGPRLDLVINQIPTLVEACAVVAYRAKLLIDSTDHRVTGCLKIIWDKLKRSIEGFEAFEDMLEMEDHFNPPVTFGYFATLKKKLELNDIPLGLCSFAQLEEDQATIALGKKIFENRIIPRNPNKPFIWNVSNVTNLLEKCSNAHKHIREIILEKQQLLVVPRHLWKFTSLTTLKLKSQEINSMERVCHMTHLSSLYLNDNKICEVPHALARCHQKLMILDLSSNQITELSPGILNLTNLIYLALSSNKIVEIPKSIHSLHALTSLSLTDNKIHEIPDSIQHLKKLTILLLEQNNLVDIAAITQLPQLKILSLSWNAIREIPPDLVHCQQLDFLNLSCNQIKSIPNLSGLRKLRNVSLTNNPLKPEEVINKFNPKAEVEL
jgi:Leucine-rich repeat (LRR) protein